MKTSEIRSGAPLDAADSPRPSAQFPLRFFVITFLWSWAIWSPQVLARYGIISPDPQLLARLGLPALILAAFGPAAGTLVSLVTLEGRSAVGRYLSRIPDLRFGRKAWLVPLFVLSGSACVAWVLPELWGEPHVGLRVPPLSLLPQFLLVVPFLSGPQEELGWRGYILDPLEQRLGPWLGNLVLGVIWGLWHLPLFLTPGSGLDTTPFGAFLLLTVGYSGFLAWVRGASGRRPLAAVYAHGLVNTCGSIFPTIVASAAGSQVRYWIWAGLAFAAGVISTAARANSRLGGGQR